MALDMESNMDKKELQEKLFVAAELAENLELLLRTMSPTGKDTKLIITAAYNKLAHVMQDITVDEEKETEIRTSGLYRSSKRSGRYSFVETNF